MGQFKPMVKMETTEPSVELKLKKGGSVKKADGGMMGGMPPTAQPMSAMPARGGMAKAATPMAPSLAARRRAMRSMGAGPSAPVGLAASRMMKKGGKSEGGAETAKEMKQDKAQDKAMIAKAFKQHDSQEHKGGKGTKLALKKGGKTYATGGVVKGQGGYAIGGMVPSGSTSVAPAMTMVDTARYDNAPAMTGGVRDGNAGGFKRGGATKKHFATGGSVNNAGSAVAMPQGRKPASSPVQVTQLSGTYKKGGKVAKLAEGGSPNDKYTLKDPKAVTDKTSRELEEALNPLSMMQELYNKARNAFNGQGSMTDKERADGSVTKTKESVTVSPGKRRGGSVC
jgi:hypothetical protein